MTAGGLEIPIAKAAASAVSRTAGPAWRRYSRSRNLKRAGKQLDLSEVILPKLTPDQGTSVSEYVASRDFHVIATQVALSALEEKAGRAVTVQENVITDQLTKALRGRGKWEPGILRQVVDVLKQDLGRAVIAILQQMTDAGSSASELAAYVENAGDHATAARSFIASHRRGYATSLTVTAGVHEGNAPTEGDSGGPARDIDKKQFYVKNDFRYEGRRLPRPDRAG